ncbi:MAG: hypothetical protein HC881_11465 [Leptolyngbyaceae cyanobacterium SL_7_1]|nr:hypothetical protein [Leptolyngbyaceae cyanobacterium SL_7_1]
MSNWLKGNLNYLLWLEHSLLVVEAKNDDLTRGFTQLAVEIIALAKAKDQDKLYGAITIGDAWRFGILDRTEKHITQDIALYRVPDDLDVLVRSLIGMIQNVE